MNARYYSIDNTLRELPSMEKPKKRVGQYRAGSLQYYQCLNKWADYNTHVAFLRTIPCSPECKEVFQDQQVYEEGRDYKIMYWYPRMGEHHYYDEAKDDWENNGFGHVLLAFPLTRQSEEEICRELLTKLYIEERFIPDNIDFLKKHYIIKKR